MKTFTDSAQFERWWPIIFGLLVTGGLFFFAAHIQNDNWQTTLDKLFAATLNISAIMIGFLATAKSIMFSLGDSRRIRDMRNSTHYGMLIDYLVRAIFWSFAMTVTSAVSIVVYPRYYPRLVLTIWGFSVIVTIACFYQVVSLLAMLLRMDRRER